LERSVGHLPSEPAVVVLEPSTTTVQPPARTEVAKPSSSVPDETASPPLSEERR